MINIKTIEKEKNNNYFVTYTENKKLFTYSGTPKEIVKELTKNFKKGNINDK